MEDMFLVTLFCMELIANLSLSIGLELPKPMKSNSPGTWAYDTMSRRVSRDIFPRLISVRSFILLFML